MRIKSQSSITVRSVPCAAHHFELFAIAIVSSVLAGCGWTAPNIAETWDRDIPENKFGVSPKVTATAQIEYEIEERILCDLQRAVQKANKYLFERGPSPQKLKVVRRGLFPANWAAQVALSLEVDETSGLNPGVAVNQVLPNAVHVFGPGTSGTVTTPQSFSLGLGGTISSTSTRIDKFNPYWSIKDLMAPIKPDSSCYPEKDIFRKPPVSTEPARSSPLIVSELGIEDWLVGAMFVDQIIPSSPQPKGSGSQGGGQKPESISIEIKFVIVTSGNITPTWKLVNVSANTGNTPLLNLGRTRTHDLIITIGPNNQQTNNSHLASQIGNAVSSGNRSLLAAPGM
jgi:hypothetical protein